MDDEIRVIFGLDHGLHWRPCVDVRILLAMSLTRSTLVLAAVLVWGTGCASSQEQPEVPVAPAPAYDEPDEAASTEYDDTDAAALTDFKPSLDPYGDWVEDPTYGTVWAPHAEVVGADFAPYVTAGHWAVDDEERWVWVSDYDPTFGWVVFHYGRWVYTDARGWVWIPGRRWAPAWVVWRVGDPGYDYVGWAPAPPYYYWHAGAVVWLGVYPPAPYVFCGTQYVFHDHVHTYLVGSGAIAGVAAGTHPYGYGAGRHYLAQPQPGPSVTSGHIGSSAWPSQRYSYDARTIRTAGRPLSSSPYGGRTPGRGVEPVGRVPSRSLGASSGLPRNGFGAAPARSPYGAPPSPRMPSPRMPSPPRNGTRPRPGGPPGTPTYSPPPARGTPTYSPSPRGGGVVAPRPSGGGGARVAPLRGGGSGSRGGVVKPSGGSNNRGGGRGGRR